MKTRYFIEIFKSNYCKFVFLISLVLVFIATPKKIFYEFYTILGIFFILITSLTITCFVRNIKEKIKEAKIHGASLIGIISIVFGIGALQACTIGAPVCGASIGAGVVALFFPGLAFGLLEKYSILITIISILIQIIALHYMKCFKVIFQKSKPVPTKNLKEELI